MRHNFTREELEAIRTLKENVGVEYLARDKQFGLHGYIGRPKKLEGIWDNDGGWRVGIKGFDSIRWEEDEPVCLADYCKQPEEDALPAHLGGNGDYTECLNNLRQIFKYNKVCSEIQGEHMTVKFTNMLPRQISFSEKEGTITVSPNGIFWRPAYDGKMEQVLDINDLKEFC